MAAGHGSPAARGPSPRPLVPSPPSPLAPSGSSSLIAAIRLRPPCGRIAPRASAGEGPAPGPAPGIRLSGPATAELLSRCAAGRRGRALTRRGENIPSDPNRSATANPSRSPPTLPRGCERQSPTRPIDRTGATRRCAGFGAGDPPPPLPEAVVTQGAAHAPTDAPQRFGRPNRWHLRCRDAAVRALATARPGRQPRGCAGPRCRKRGHALARSTTHAARVVASHSSHASASFNAQPRFSSRQHRVS